MTYSKSALFCLERQPGLDQISPVIYKIGERNNISLDVVLDAKVSYSDYRIQLIDQYDNITVSRLIQPDSDTTVVDRMFSLAKEINRALPTDILRKLYYASPQGDNGVIPRKFFTNNYSVIAFDWSLADGSNVMQFTNSDDVSSIVLPHGDSPFMNRIETQGTFERFLSDQSNFDTHSNSSEIGYHSYEKYADYDYSIFPNGLTASRMPEYTPDEQMRIFGSPRYNPEWLQIVSKHRPKCDLPEHSKLKVVFFLRREGYFISVNEVENTIRLLNEFDNVIIIIKEHPREDLLTSEVTENMENITIVQDDITSASLIEYGDIFLSLGTTICFEPIMRMKPVVEIEYAHSNLTVVSDYFPSAGMRCKEELYHVIYELSKNGTDDYYNESARDEFISSMISPNKSPVLDQWAEFIESLC
jgi:hypothetical protein